MINQILNDLEKNVRSIYQNSNLITLHKFMHHASSYDDVRKILDKYGMDIKKFREILYKHINEEELVNENKKNKNVPLSLKTKKNIKNQEIDMEIILADFFNNFQDNDFKTEQRLDPNYIYIEEDLRIIFDLASQMEMIKITKKAQQNGQGAVITPSDVSFGSFLKAVLYYIQKTRKKESILLALKESSFNIEKFTKDEEEGKENNKSALDELCTNLNKKASEGGIQNVIGRDDEIDQIIYILSKGRKNNPILVGPAGVGKTAIAEGLAKRIVDGKVPKKLKNAVIYNLEMVNIVAGTAYRGAFEQKVKDLRDELKDKKNNGEMPILFIDEIHTIMGAGSSGQGSFGFSEIIKPDLARGELRTIGATTTDEWYQFIKENPALDRRFVSVSIKEPSRENTIKIINESINYYEKIHDVKYDINTIEKAVDLTSQFIVDNAQPDKAFDIIDTAGAMCSTLKKKNVSIEDIENTLAKQKNIDLSIIQDLRQGSFEPIENFLKTKIFGQDDQIKKIGRPIDKASLNLHNKNKPVASFLLTGPTGTGKTETAKLIAEKLKYKFYRIDCGKLKESHRISELLGAPAGYVGHEQGSQLTKIINENPKTVLLFDEIEKAHQDIYDLFLQIMDYGKLTDGKGKEINMKNIILIMTSNLGSDIIANSKKIGLQVQNPIENVENKNEAVQNFFKPEFLGRLTGNKEINFSPLSLDVLKKIVIKKINEIQADRLHELGVNIKVDEKAIEHIALYGEKTKLGARPIENYIETSIIDVIVSDKINGVVKNNYNFTVKNNSIQCI